MSERLIDTKDKTIGDVFRLLCVDANTVVTELDDRRAKEYGRNYRGFASITNRVPGLGLYLGYVPLPGSSAAHCVKIGDHEGVSLLGLHSNYERKNGKAVPKLDTGIIQAYYSERSTIFPDYSIRRDNDYISIEDYVVPLQPFKDTSEIDILGHGDKQRIKSVSHMIAASIRAVELIVDGRSIPEALAVRTRLISNAI